ncbi:unnamed protein product [Linum trigynum]|uniref:Secreted protein n=1 Tax=Linum trigynum TaxID=586398 RepID=A0AAV2CF48_9ROSI
MPPAMPPRLLVSMLAIIITMFHSSSLQKKLLQNRTTKTRKVEEEKTSKIGLRPRSGASSLKNSNGSSVLGVSSDLRPTSCVEPSWPLAWTIRPMTTNPVRFPYLPRSSGNGNGLGFLALTRLCNGSAFSLLRLGLLFSEGVS